MYGDIDDLRPAAVAYRQSFRSDRVFLLEVLCGKRCPVRSAIPRGPWQRYSYWPCRLPTPDTFRFARGSIRCRPVSGQYGCRRIAPQQLMLRERLDIDDRVWRGVQQPAQGNAKEARKAADIQCSGVLLFPVQP